MTVADIIPHAEQPAVAGDGVGHEVPRRAAVEKAGLLEKAGKPALRHIQLLCRGAKVGAAVRVHKGVVVIRLGQQRLALRPVPQVLRMGGVEAFHQRVQ